MKRRGVVILLCSMLAVPALTLANTSERLDSAADVLNSLTATPDKGVPLDLIKKAQCIVIVPSLKKAAFVVGGEQGKGFVSCRTKGGWSAPAAMQMEAGSVGFQIGGSETELVMLVMNEKGMDRLLSNKFTLGADASVAAGPVGRSATAKTDVAMTAEILSWSRSRGVFAGASLQGATLRQDADVNTELYGKPLTNREVLAGGVSAPPAAAKLMAAIRKY
jgi:SH3 domain-containing YSC84-like protein 1